MCYRLKFADRDYMTDRKTRIWITWEQQRRNVELASAFGCELQQIEYPPGLLRYLLSIVRTSRLLARRSSGTVFVQCPSLVLATLAALFRSLRKFTLVVDAHNVTFEYLEHQRALVRLLAKFALQRADLVLVSNPALLESLPIANGVVLPDKLPQLRGGSTSPISEHTRRPAIVLVSTFAADEPIADFISAFEQQPVGTLFVTGKKSKAATLLERAQERIVFTDFLPAAEYDKLLQSADLIVDLTTRPHCLVCGAYEAISAEVPLLLSKDATAEEIFGSTISYTVNSVAEYREALATLAARLTTLKAEMPHVKESFNRRWQEYFVNAEQQIARHQTQVS